MKEKLLLFRSPIIKGTILLTSCAVLSRLLGFFLRILLSNLLGPEGMGIYQLSFPIFGIGYSLCCSGLELAISRFTAAEKEASRSILSFGLSVSLGLSFLFCLILSVFAAPVADALLKESRTEPLIRILALSLPFAAAHSCICSYYLGRKQPLIPGVSQLAEQTIRVGTILICYGICQKHAQEFSPSTAILGILTGEIAVALWLFLLTGKEKRRRSPFPFAIPMLKMAAPVTINRLSLTFLGSMEAILIPSRLVLSGLTNMESLSVYGILTGMAFPFLAFPCTLTGSASSLLLPEIAEAAAAGNQKKIRKSIGLSVAFSLGFGCICTIFFFLTGPFLGNVVFGNPTAGAFIKTLSFLSPFLFLGMMLGSTLNGLGMSGAVFAHNMIGVSLRLFFTLFLVPEFGIQAVLWGLLADKGVVAMLHLVRVQMNSGKMMQ